MSSYGAVAQKGRASKASGKSLEASHSKSSSPFFLENPDGTITEAVPSNVQEPTPKARPSHPMTTLARHLEGSDSDGSLGNLSENAAASMYSEVEFLYNQHARVMLLLVLLHAALMVLYNFVYLTRLQDGSSEKGLRSMYGVQDQEHLGEKILWTVFVLLDLYHVWFYATAVSALWSGRPACYRDLANCGIVGIIGMVFLAYVDKFNLLVFFLDLLIYIYARFMQGLTASLILLPSPTVAAATGP